MTGAAKGRPLVEGLVESRIREVANAGMGMEDLIPLWYGEPDTHTPDFIVNAAVDAMKSGHTFYTENLGVDELRHALADYMSGLHQKPITKDRVTVTGSGMIGVNLLQQLLTEPGDNLVVTAPVWPNMVESIRLMHGEPRLAPIKLGNDGWKLDPEDIFALVDSDTKAILINSPNNPTGWIMERADQQLVLDFAREKGIWVLADEVYNRIVFDRAVSPSFLDLAEPEDRVVVINSFSKTWAMTGWRLGWLTVPSSLQPTLQKLIEFHYSCAADFTQQAAIAAVRDGEEFIQSIVQKYRLGRDLVCDRLLALPNVRIAKPGGAFYAFFEVAGVEDSVELCRDILRRTKVGLAPGSAFGTGYENYVRLCFANSEERLSKAMDLIVPVLAEGR